MRAELNRKGYTLIELLLCLALLGLLAGITAAPTFNRQRSQQVLQTTALGFANDLRAARFSAIAEGRAYRVDVYATNYTVTVAASDNWQIIKRVYWPPGIRRVGTLHAKFSFPATGLFHELDNNTVTLADTHNRRVQVIVSGGGRIRLA